MLSLVPFYMLWPKLSSNLMLVKLDSLFSFFSTRAGLGIVSANFFKALLEMP